MWLHIPNKHEWHWYPLHFHEIQHVYPCNTSERILSINLFGYIINVNLYWKLHAAIRTIMFYTGLTVSSKLVLYRCRYCSELFATLVTVDPFQISSHIPCLLLHRKHHKLFIFNNTIKTNKILRLCGVSSIFSVTVGYCHLARSC